MQTIEKTFDASIPVDTTTTTATPRTELRQRFTTLTEEGQNVASQSMSLIVNGVTGGLNLVTLMLAGFFLAAIGVNDVTDFRSMLKNTLRTMVTKLMRDRRLDVNLDRVNAWINEFVDQSATGFTVQPGTTLVGLTSVWRTELLPSTRGYNAFRGYFVEAALTCIIANGVTVKTDDRTDYAKVLALGFNESIGATATTGAITTSGLRYLQIGEHRTLTPTSGTRRG